MYCLVYRVQSEVDPPLASLGSLASVTLGEEASHEGKYLLRMFGDQILLLLDLYTSLLSISLCCGFPQCLMEICESNWFECLRKLMVLQDCISRHSAKFH